MILDALINLAFVAISFVVSLFACGWMMRIGVVDSPDGARKQQDRPIPRLGGVAMAIAVVLGSLIGIALFALVYAGSLSAFIATLRPMIVDTVAAWGAVLGFVAIAFAIGVWDDIATANTKAKLALFAAACVTGALIGIRPDALPTPWGAFSAPAFLIVGSALWLLVFTNAANFMDGSNGLALGCLAIMLVGLGSIAATSDSLPIPFWGFALIGAIGGFLVHNLCGAIYAGDAGALGIGGLFAAMSITSGIDVWTVATLGLPFLIDVLLTLVWRTKHGRNLLEAHLDHAYQRLIASGWSHFETAFLYWGFSSTAAILAYIGTQAGGAAPFAIFWTLTLAGSSIWVLHRRTAKRDDLVN